MPRTRTRPQIENHKGLLTYREDGVTYHLNYLLSSPQHGVFEPEFGKVDVTAEEAEMHNRLLSEAERAGLDECALGQGRPFYVGRADDGTLVVRTWHGDLISDRVVANGMKLTFVRNNRVFEGFVARDDASCTSFTRIL